MESPREKKISPRLETNRLEILKVTKEDSDWLFNLIHSNKVMLARHLNWVNAINTVDDQLNAIADMLENWQNESQFCYTLRFQDEGIGMLSVINCDRSKNTCEIGYWLAGHHGAKGLMSEAIQALEKELARVGLKYIYIKCDANNFKSIQLAKRNNFQLIQVSKKDYLINGVLTDTHVFMKNITVNLKKI